MLPDIRSLVGSIVIFCLRFRLRSSTRAMAAIINTSPIAAPTPTTAFAPALRDVRSLPPSVLALAMVEAGDKSVVELVLAEVLVLVDVDEVGVGMKSYMVIVCCKSSSGAGASKVSLKLPVVEQAVSPSQHAQELLLEL